MASPNKQLQPTTGVGCRTCRTRCGGCSYAVSIMGVRWPPLQAPRRRAEYNCRSRQINSHDVISRVKPSEPRWQASLAVSCLHQTAVLLGDPERVPTARSAVRTSDAQPTDRATSRSSHARNSTLMSSR
jgi:hypothetical protein